MKTFEREIKFRCWNHKTKKWVDPYIVSIDGYGQVEIGGAEVNFCNIEFWTGLKDKNGKDIYAGCIFKNIVTVNKSLHGEFSYYQFEIKNGLIICSYLKSEKNTGIPKGYLGAVFTDFFDVDMKTILFANECILTDCEIIGNIHETPELL